MTERRYSTRALYATRYMVRNRPTPTLTHTALVIGDEVMGVICGKVKVESVMEDEGATDAAAMPTCAKCAARDPRFVAGAR